MGLEKKILLTIEYNYKGFNFFNLFIITNSHNKIFIDMENSKKRVIVEASSYRRTIVARGLSFNRLKERCTEAFAEEPQNFLYVPTVGEKYAIFDDESFEEALAQVEVDLVLFTESAEPPLQKRRRMETVTPPTLSLSPSGSLPPTEIQSDPETSNPDQIPYCLHNQLCVCYTARTQKNWGRKFYRCTYAGEQHSSNWYAQCKAFIWQDKIEELDIPLCNCFDKCRLQYVEYSAQPRRWDWMMVCAQRNGSCSYKETIPNEKHLDVENLVQLAKAPPQIISRPKIKVGDDIITKNFNLFQRIKK